MRCHRHGYRHLRGEAARLEPDGRRAEQEGRRSRVPGTGRPELAQRPGGRDEHDGRHDDDAQDGGQLAAAERPDQAVPLRLVLEPRALAGHQTAVRNWK